jgi:hypothetical protein
MPQEFGAMGQAAMRGGVAGLSAAQVSGNGSSIPGGTSLSQIYALARQQAVAEVEGRKWRELIEKIMQ